MDCIRGKFPGLICFTFTNTHRQRLYVVRQTVVELEAVCCVLCVQKQSHVTVDRQTDRQAGRQAGKQAGRQTERDRDTKSTDTHRQTERIHNHYMHASKIFD
jgi:hypothetical protein